MVYQVTKTYGHERGLSCAFRQHGASSHCRFLHGYALAFTFVFESDGLDSNNWVIDFGGLKPLRAALEASFDHKVAVAESDPELNMFKTLESLGLADLLILERVGCEAFAEYAGRIAAVICDRATSGNAWLVSATCAEHGANSATWKPSRAELKSIVRPDLPA